MKVLTQLVTLFCITVFSILLSIQILFTRTYISLLYSYHPLLKDPYGWTAAEQFQKASATLRFIKTDNTLNTIETLYTEPELKHLQDVQKVYRSSTQAFYLVTILIILITVFSFVRKRIHVLFKIIKTAYFTFLIVFSLFSLSLIILWPLFFTLFHVLLFTPGTWQFPADSTLIRLFPEAFWVTSTVSLGILTYLILRLLGIVLHLCQKIHCLRSRSSTTG